LYLTRSLLLLIPLMLYSSFSPCTMSYCLLLLKICRSIALLCRTGMGLQWRNSTARSKASRFPHVHRNTRTKICATSGIRIRS
jgi:hypothetical protein